MDSCPYLISVCFIHIRTLFKKGTTHWVVYTNGSYNKAGSGIGYLIITPSGQRIERSVRLKFKASNIKVEYKAAIYSLMVAKDLGAMRIQLFTDSKLIASQFGCIYQAKMTNQCISGCHLVFS